MIKCPQCDFEAKNENGLRLHSKKHGDQGIVKTSEEPKVPVKKTIAKLIDIDGNVCFVFSLEKSGQEWLKQAMNTAEKKKLKLEFE